MLMSLRDTMILWYLLMLSNNNVGERIMIFADKPWVKNLGVVIAIISFVGSIYMWFFYKKAPNYEYEIMSMTTILVEHAGLPSIKIYVDSVDIRHSEENISIIEVKVANTGKAALRRDDYDVSDFGLNILNGQLLGPPELINTSTDYLRHCLMRHDFHHAGSFINVPILPLDSNDFYQLKLVVLHKEGESVMIVPVGKIIGQREIEVNEDFKSKEPFFSRLFDENVWVHLLRLLCYLILIFSILAVVIAIDDKIDERKKNKAMQKIQSSYNFDNDIINAYYKYGDRLFEDMMSIYKIPEKELYQKYMSSINYTKSEKNKANVDHWKYHNGRMRIFQYMLRNNYLIMTNNQIRFNKDKKKTVKGFYTQILAEGLVSNDSYVTESSFNRDNTYTLRA